MLNKILLSTATVLCATLSFSAHAESGNRTVEQIYKECGIGGLIFADVSPIVAIISNVTWDLGTTAALSNSMSPSTCNTPTVKTAYFIKETFGDLENNLAQGKGEHLQALNSLMACDAATTGVRREYAQYTTTQSYATATVDNNVEKLFEIVNSSLSSAGCSAS